MPKKIRILSNEDLKKIKNPKNREKYAKKRN